MAAGGIACVSVPKGGSVSFSSTSTARGRPPTEMHATMRLGVLRTDGPKSSLSARLFSGRVVASHSVESAKEDISLLYPNTASTGTRKFEMLQCLRLGDAATDDLAMLSDGFVKGGEITELNMDRLVEAMLQEEGQSKEDYQRRAIFFNRIAEFFRQGRAYSAEKDESANFARTMQLLVDSILAEDGRSARDYNARAQFFAKSAGVFPFNAEVRSI